MTLEDSSVLKKKGRKVLNYSEKIQVKNRIRYKSGSTVLP